MMSFTFPAIHKLMFPIALMIGLAGAPLVGHAEIYKWVDQDNQIQYTQTPPPTGIASVRIESGSHADEGSPRAGNSTLDERLKDSAERQQEADAAAARAEKEAEIARIIKANCAAARNNLEQLNRNGQIRYRDSEGRVLRLSDEERARRIEESKMQIEEYCKG
jgi:hypothetical protein